jgi:hypothetical protein
MTKICTTGHNSTIAKNIELRTGSERIIQRDVDLQLAPAVARIFRIQEILRIQASFRIQELK